VLLDGNGGNGSGGLHALPACVSALNDRQIVAKHLG